MRNRGEKGQAVLVVVIAIALVLIGGIGLAIDSSQLYGQRQMAQVAADAAALGAIMSIFDRTNTGPNLFGATNFTCITSTDVRTPCKYAQSNGFGKTSDDQVAVSFPTSAPGVTLSADYSPNLVHVLITRTVSNWFIKLVGGPATTSVKAAATAAIVDVMSPVPIIVKHPTLPQSFSISGSGDPATHTIIKICGGPSRSIQVNSDSLNNTINVNGNTKVDLSKAGTADDGFCNTGTGADFGDWGGPTPYPGNLLLGTTGHYIQPSSPIEDPLKNVNPPSVPANAPAKASLANGVNGCPSSPPRPCKLYFPGNYPSGINVTNETAVFSPGIYYMSSGGFQNGANGQMLMASGVPPDPSTGWSCTTQATCHMMVYNAGNAFGDVFDVGANSGANLVGSPDVSPYKGILFFEDRSASAHTGAHSHKLGGGGNITLSGTIYTGNSNPTSSTYQNLRFRGSSGSSTLIIGMIITDTLDLAGSNEIVMDLNPNSFLHIPQVALVK